MNGAEVPRGPTLRRRAFIAVFAFFFALTLALALLAFPAGAYTLLFTTVTQGMNGATPLSLFVWIGPVPLRIPGEIPAGWVLIGLLCVYALLLAYAARRGGLLDTFRSSLDSGPSVFLRNELVAIFVFTGFLAFTATALDSVVQSTGVQIGGLTQSDFLVFVSTTISPLTEEVGFRVGIIGIAALVMSAGLPWRRSLLALWRPKSAYDGPSSKGRRRVLWGVLILSSLAFGTAHVASGSGWELGKLPEAVYGGLVLGYVYVEYGLHAAVLTHWGIDYLGTVYSYLGKGAFGVPVDSFPGFVLQEVVNLDLLAGFGLVSFLLVVYVLLGRAKERLQGATSS